MSIRSIAKKIICFCLVLFKILLCTNYSFCANNDNYVKRVISLVYDDSFSMKQNGQDYYYANYTLQNIVGMMNDTDELNVVYLSNENTNNMKNMTNVLSRKNYIDELKMYTQYSNSTNFDAIRTAADYLRDKKSLYGNDNTYKYYLVVLTDGIFENSPKNISQYFGDLRNEFVGGFFKGVFVGIGDNVNKSFIRDVLANEDYYYVESNGDQDIVKAVFEAHDIIYNRETLSENKLIQANNSQSLLFNADKNINRIIVLEQNQHAKVLDITSGGREMDNIVDFRCDKTTEPYLSSIITHTSSSNGAIPKGQVRIDFDRPVSKSYENTRILVEYTDAEVKDRIVEETTTKPIEPTTSVSTKPTTISPEPTTISPGPTTKSLESTMISPGPTTEPTNPIPTTIPTIDPTIDPIINIGHHCPCPLIKILLILFLISLLKSIHDRKINRTYYNNKYRNSNNAEYVNTAKSQDEHNDYRESEDYYNKRIIIRSILISLLVMLWMLCQLFWCKCNFVTCWTKCCWMPSGCGCHLSRCSMVPIDQPIVPMEQSIVPPEPITETDPTDPIPTTGPIIDPTIDPTTRTISMPTTGPSPTIDPTTGTSIYPTTGPRPTTVPIPTTDPTPTTTTETETTETTEKETTRPINPTPPPPPIPKIPILQFLVFAILLGYLFKNRFDIKNHGFEVKGGEAEGTIVHALKAKATSKIIPYVPENTLVQGLQVKAAKKKDRVIIPQSFLTEDMRVSGEKIDTSKDFTLFEDIELTRTVNGNKITYIYKNYPDTGINL